MESTQKEALFNDIVNIHGDKIFRLCTGYITNNLEVNDLFQEVLINIWNNLEKFRGDSKITTWIYRITVNTALLHHRKLKIYEKIRSNLETDLTHSYDQQDTDGKDEEAVRMLKEAISRLKDHERLIITLLLEDLSYEEISEIVGISVNYVGVRINRIKKQLQKLMVK